MTLKKAVQALRQSKRIIAKERDKMRAILEEFLNISETTDGALMALDEAIDKLSEQL